MSDLDVLYQDFLNEVLRTAEISGDLQASAFFELYKEAATESGDIGDLEYCPVVSEARNFRLDGYWYVKDQGELTLAISDFRDEQELQSLNAASVEILFRKVERFYQNALRPEFISALEEVSPAFQAAYLIYSYAASIRRVRVIVFSNARLAVRKELVTMREIEGTKFSFSVLDFQRYVDIQESRMGAENIEIDFEDVYGEALPCLPAYTGSGDYKSYLVVVPGSLLATIYGLYGARLLEQNVRTFLQARTKVNKGIIRTLTDEPEKFFAYNNGLTATASNIEFTEGLKGMHIKALTDFQIVNGGQTTASILYAQDKKKTDLKDVYVQMKLSVIEPDLIEEVVPAISRYANTQNKVNKADFFSSSPFHLELEKISRRLSAPAKEGELLPTKWFYERARGQYRDQQAYLTAAAKRKFQSEFPKNQMLVKTDLAKYEMSFSCKPFIVSKGAQKCFMSFAEEIDKKWDDKPQLFGEGYFKDAMARALIFRWTDKMIAGSDWYQNDRGYKAQTVTYTIAVIVHALKQKNQQIDYRAIWNRQTLPESLMTTLETVAPVVAAHIKSPPENVRNVGEYCKTQACWKSVQSLEVDVSLLKDVTVSFEDVSQQKKADKKEKLMDDGIEAQQKVWQTSSETWQKVKEMSQERRILISPKESRLLERAIAGQNFLEKDSLTLCKLLARAEEEGLNLQDTVGELA